MTESSFSWDLRMALSVWDLARRLSPHPMPKAKENYSTTLCLHNLESITLINRLLWGHPQSNPSSERLQRSKKVLIYQQKWPFCFGFSFCLSLLSAASLILMKAPRERALCAICNFRGLGTKYCESPYFRRLTTVVPSLLHHRHKMAGKSGKILVGDLKILSNADRDVTPAETNAI